MNKTIDLTASIASFNGKNYLKNCLKSIFRNTRDIKFEVIVVDNASVDGTVEMVKDEFPQVILIRNSQNVGYAKANNQAIKQAKGRYIVILNHDTIILDNAFRKMVTFLDRNLNAGALGCKIYTSLAKTDIQTSAFRKFPTPVVELAYTLLNGKLKKIFSHSKIINRLTGKFPIDSNNFAQEQEVKHLVGAIIMVRREVIEDVGLLDEQFFMYFEETDWCYRMYKKGWKVYYIPNAEIIHFYDPSRSTTGALKRIRQESYLKYLKKYHSLFSIIFFKIIYTLLSLKSNF